MLTMIMRFGTHGRYQTPVHPRHTFALVYPDRAVDTKSHDDHVVPTDPDCTRFKVRCSANVMISTTSRSRRQHGALQRNAEGCCRTTVPSRR